MSSQKRIGNDTIKINRILLCLFLVSVVLLFSIFFYSFLFGNKYLRESCEWNPNREYVEFFDSKYGLCIERAN